METKRTALKSSHWRTRETAIHLASAFISIAELTQEGVAADIIAAACA